MTKQIATKESNKQGINIESDLLRDVPVKPIFGGQTAHTIGEKGGFMATL